MPRGPPRAFETFHTWFEKVINFRWCQIGEETFPIHARCVVGPVVLPHPVFRTSSWFLYRSFFKVGKSREKGICFEFMLWILNEFLRVFLQGGLTGFRFKLLMNDGVDWVSRFTRLVLCSETRTRTEDGERTTEETKMEGVRNNFSYARSCQGRVSRRWVCENLKYANSV